MKIDTLKTLSDIVTAWIGVIALIAGGFFAAYEYLEKVSEDRIKQSLSYVDSFHKAPIINVRDRIEKAVFKHSKELQPFVDKNAKYDKFCACVINIVEKEKMETDIMTLVDYYDSLAICSEKRICDSKLAHAYFDDHVKSFYILFLPYIKSWREQWKTPSFAVATGAFVLSKDKNKANNIGSDLMLYLSNKDHIKN